MKTNSTSIFSVGNCALDPTLGSGKTRLRWAEGLRAAGFQVQSKTPADIMRDSSSRFGWRFWLALEARHLHGIEQHDLLECYGAEFGLLQRRWAGCRPRPLIVAHTDGLELLAAERQRGLFKRNLKQKLTAPLHTWLDWTAFRYADALVAGCEADIAFARKHGLFAEHNSFCLNPGIDAEYLGLRFQPAREHLVLYLGTWNERKAPARIVRVMANVMANEPACRFEVVGASGAQPEILGAFESGLRNRVLVHSKLPTNELCAVLARAKVMFFPSHYEGFGMATAEAMACGCAVVTTPTGFGADLRDGVEGFVRDFDDEGGMEENILRLLRYDAVRVPMAETGWRRVQELSWGSQCRRLAETYSGWLDRWERARGSFRAAAPVKATA